MPDSFEEQAWVKFSVTAALSREYAKDQKFFLEMLAKTLEQALPAETEVVRRGLIKKTLASVTVSFESNRYTFEDRGNGTVKATRIHIVRGIALKNEQMPVEEALAEMGHELETKAQSDARAREALASMLGLS